MAVKFLDLRSQTDKFRADLERAIAGVYEESQYILGPKVREFERAWRDYCGAAGAIGVASGTDALFLSFKLLGIGPGDEVIVPALTAPPTAVAVAMTGARPVFADILHDTMLMDPESVAQKISARTRALVPVHLYGCIADMTAIKDVAGTIDIVEDASQAHGASLGGRRAGAFGRLAAFSFYPTKNLGAWGDAGMIVTRDPEDGDRLAMMRDYGRSDPHTVSVRGINSRMDELQAAVLLAKMKHLEEWNQRRREIAARYSSGFADLPLVLPFEPEGSRHVYHQYVIRTDSRDTLREHLEGRGIETAILYPKLVCDHPVFASGPGGGTPDDLPVARRAVSRLMSLPAHPGLSDPEIELVIKAVRGFFIHEDPHCVS